MNTPGKLGTGFPNVASVSGCTALHCNFSVAKKTEIMPREIYGMKFLDVTREASLHLAGDARNCSAMATMRHMR